jgi:single-stranded-DNA-specific exonuclease
MMGQNATHLKMFVSKDNSQNIECVKWNFPDFNLPLNSKLDLLFSMQLNVFNGKTSVQLMIEDIHSEFLTQQQNQVEIKLLDHRNKTNILMQVIDFAMNTKKTTAIYLSNPALKKQLKLPEILSDKLFCENDIPSDIEQIMFFDTPTSQNIFCEIINKTNAKTVHLMNFDIQEITLDTFISKLSGMLKYALSNLNGIFNLERAARALKVTEDTVECALTLLEEVEMIDLDKIKEGDFKISYVHPIELSKVKQAEMFNELETQINEINDFMKFYLTSPIEEIKSCIR